MPRSEPGPTIASAPAASASADAHAAGAYGPENVIAASNAVDLRAGAVAYVPIRNRTLRLRLMYTPKVVFGEHTTQGISFFTNFPLVKIH